MRITRWGLAGLALAGMSLATFQAAQAATDLVFWAENGTNIPQSGLIEKFEKENPQYHVVITEYPWQVAHDKLVGAMSTGDTPDIVLSEDQWVGEFAHLG